MVVKANRCHADGNAKNIRQQLTGNLFPENLEGDQQDHHHQEGIHHQSEQSPKRLIYNAEYQELILLPKGTKAYHQKENLSTKSIEITDSGSFIGITANLQKIHSFCIFA